MKRMILLLLLGSATMTNAQIVNIPDANFKAYLVGNTAINTNGDLEIQVSEANVCTSAIQVGGLNISDLSGIEKFVSITFLDCENNQINSLDISSNILLAYLNCRNNLLTSLDVSGFNNLQTLFCDYNQLASLDVTGSSVTSIHCAGNQLTSLDLTTNSQVGSLYCNDNLLTNLNISNSLLINTLIIYGNELTSIDLSNHTALDMLLCGQNLFTSVDISFNTVLTSFNCSFSSQLIWINATNQTLLTSFSTPNCPNLVCIKVDDISWSMVNWTDIDPVTSFSLDCTGAGVSEVTQLEVSVFPNPTSSSITIESSESIKSVLIFNTLGELTQQESSVSFSVENLPSGIYLVRIKTESGIVRSRFVKQ